MDSLKFTTEREQLAVKIDGDDYVLCEPTGADVSAYRNALAKNQKVSPDGSITMFGSPFEAELLLLSRCLLKGDAPVAYAFAQGLPARVSGPMIDAIKKLGSIEQEPDEEPAKN